MLTFEKEIENLQGIVKKLESGELSLEESLKAFEDGVKLARSCQEKLSAAEKKIEVLVKVTPEGQVETRKFEQDTN